MFEIMQKNIGDIEQWLEELQHLLVRNAAEGGKDE